MQLFVFACVHNAGRSQMSAALFNRYADPQQAATVSAGTQPGTHVHPVVVDVMREVGIDLSAARPQKLTADLARGAEMLITMGCGDECPYVPASNAMTGRCPIQRGEPPRCPTHSRRDRRTGTTS